MKTFDGQVKHFSSAINILCHVFADDANQLMDIEKNATQSEMDIENQEHHDAVTTFCQLIYPEQFCGTLSMHSLWTSKPHFLQRKPCDGD